MNLIERVKNILVTPKTEWAVIDGETASMSSLLTTYVLPLAILSVLGSLVRTAFWTSSMGLGGIRLGMGFAVMTACISLVSAILSFVITTYVVDMLAPSFKSEKNLAKSAQLVAYSATANWVAGLLAFIPFIYWLILLAGWVYSIYLMYLGVGPLKKTPEDQRVVYVVIILVVLFVVAMAIGAILGGILLTGAIATTGLMSH